MKNKKRIIALGMASVMMFGGSLTAVAADPSGANGTAISIEGTAGDLYKTDNVYSLTVPTEAAIKQAISYKVDPQGFAEEKGDATAGSRVLFKHTEGGKTSYSSTSDKIKLVSKSSIPISLKIEPKLTAATAGSGEHVYAGGFSTTSDFSADADKTKGLYLGIHSTNEFARSLNTTALDYTNLIYSGKDLFEVTGDVDTGYTYAIPSTVTEGFPEYEFYLTGEINPNVAASTWAVYNSDGVTVDTVAAMPTVEFKITPTAVTGATKTAVATWNDDYSISVKKSTATEEDGGFATGATVTLNGKTVATSDFTIDKGVIKITWANIAKTYDSTFTADKYADELNTMDAAICVTVANDGTYYGVAQ